MTTEHAIYVQSTLCVALDGTTINSDHGAAVAKISLHLPSEELRSGTAHRIAACWNACQGISTESLEANGVTSFEAAVVMTRQQATLRESLRKARANFERVDIQKDELLQALRSASAFLESYSVGAMSRNNAESLAAEELESIRAFIAKIGGAA